MAFQKSKAAIRGVSTGDNGQLITTDWKELATADQLCNPNLLDNWYFCNPVNQRNGYIIPAGVEYNDLSWNHAGTTDKAYPVVGYSGRDPLITIDGTNYIVGVAAQVSGYCMPGYTIDRWKSDGDTITITANSLKIDSTSKTHLFLQPIEEKLHRLLANKTVTFSVLSDNKNMDGWYITDVNGFATEHNDVRFDGNLATFTFTVADFKSLSSVGIFSGKEDISISLIAAKLELGDHQTLAHKEGDTWVLNEIPDFGEQLARCQRYAFSPLYEAYATAVICNLFISRVEKGIAFGEVTLPVSMRNKPIFSGNASKFWIVPENGGEPSHPTLIYVMGLSADKAMIQVNGSYAANTQYILYIENPFTSADFLLSADL